MLRHEPPSLMGVDLNTLVRVHRMIYGGGIEMESGVGVQMVDNLPNIEDSISCSDRADPSSRGWQEVWGFNLACEVSLEKTT